MNEDFLENLAALEKTHADITLGHTEETRLHIAACEYATNSVLERPVEKELKRLAWLCYYQGYKAGHTVATEGQHE